MKYKFVPWSVSNNSIRNNYLTFSLKKTVCLLDTENVMDDHQKSELKTAYIFQQFKEQGENFLDSIVIEDETWALHNTPESKTQSTELRHSNSPSKNKFKPTFTVQKIIATIYWDWKGPLLVEFLPLGQTMNSVMYCKTLKKLHRDIQNIQQGLFTNTFWLLHDAPYCSCNIKSFGQIRMGYSVTPLTVPI